MNASGASAAIDQRNRLRAALGIVAQMAEEPAIAAETPEARLSRTAAYARAAPIARRRFDALAAEAGAFAAAGIAALIRYRDAEGTDCAPAAAQLARDMRAALAAMDRLAPAA